MNNKSPFNITAIVFVSTDHLMKRGWQMGADDPPLLTLPFCTDYIQATIGEKFSVMDSSTFYELSQIRRLPKGKIVIFGISQNDWKKHHTSQDQSVICCETIDEIKSAMLAGCPEIFLTTFKKSVMEQFRPFLRKVHFLVVDKILEASKDFYGFPGFHKEVWNKGAKQIIREESAGVEKVTLSIWNRSEEWEKELSDLQDHMNIFWQTNPAGRNQKKFDRYCQLHRRNGVSEIEIVQNALGKRFSEIYEVYEKNIPNEYQEYATEPSLKLSGKGQQHKIFCTIIDAWSSLGVTLESVGVSTCDVVTQYVFEELFPKDILHGDRSKDLTLPEVARIVEAVFVVLGVQVEKPITV